MRDRSLFALHPFSGLMLSGLLAASLLLLAPGRRHPAPTFRRSPGVVSSCLLDSWHGIARPLQVIGTLKLRGGVGEQKHRDAARDSDMGSDSEHSVPPWLEASAAIEQERLQGPRRDIDDLMDALKSESEHEAEMDISSDGDEVPEADDGLGDSERLRDLEKKDKRLDEIIRELAEVEKNQTEHALRCQSCAERNRKLHAAEGNEPEKEEDILTEMDKVDGLGLDHGEAEEERLLQEYTSMLEEKKGVQEGNASTGTREAGKGADSEEEESQWVEVPSAEFPNIHSVARDSETQEGPGRVWLRGGLHRWLGELGIHGTQFEVKGDGKETVMEGQWRMSAGAAGRFADLSILWGPPESTQMDAVPFSATLDVVSAGFRFERCELASVGGVVLAAGGQAEVRVDGCLVEGLPGRKNVTMWGFARDTQSEVAAGALCLTGVEVLGEANVWLNDSCVRHTGVMGFPGVWVGDSGSILLEQCRLIHNTVGVLLSNAGKAVLRSCEVMSSNVGAFRAETNALDASLTLHQSLVSDPFIWASDVRPGKMEAVNNSFQGCLSLAEEMVAHQLLAGSLKPAALAEAWNRSVAADNGANEMSTPHPLDSGGHGEAAGMEEEAAFRDMEGNVTEGEEVSNDAGDVHPEQELDGKWVLWGAMDNDRPERTVRGSRDAQLWQGFPDAMSRLLSDVRGKQLSKIRENGRTEGRPRGIGEDGKEVTDGKDTPASKALEEFEDWIEQLNKEGFGQWLAADGGASDKESARSGIDKLLFPTRFQYGNATYKSFEEVLEDLSESTGHSPSDQVVDVEHDPQGMNEDATDAEVKTQGEPTQDIADAKYKQWAAEWEAQHGPVIRDGGSLDDDWREDQFMAFCEERLAQERSV